VAVPSLMIALVLFALNLLGDGLTDRSPKASQR
jgi:ABC-type dipeptide/oligopeptide/nickel transport system permease subunit